MNHDGDVGVNRAAIFAVFSQTPAATVRAGTASRVATRCRSRFRCKGRGRRRGTRSPRHSDSTAPCHGKTEVCVCVCDGLDMMCLMFISVCLTINMCRDVVCVCVFVGYCVCVCVVAHIESSHVLCRPGGCDCVCVCFRSVI